MDEVGGSGSADADEQAFLTGSESPEAMGLHVDQTFCTGLNRALGDSLTRGAGSVLGSSDLTQTASTWGGQGCQITVMANFAGFNSMGSELEVEIEEHADGRTTLRYPGIGVADAGTPTHVQIRLHEGRALLTLCSTLPADAYPGGFNGVGMGMGMPALCSAVDLESGERIGALSAAELKSDSSEAARARETAEAREFSLIGIFSPERQELSTLRMAGAPQVCRGLGARDEASSGPEAGSVERSSENGGAPSHEGGPLISRGTGSGNTDGDDTPAEVAPGS